MEMLDLRLDGNAIGGLLLERFGSDLTALEMICGACGAHGELARLDVYLGAGIVGRCRHCEAVMIRIVEGRGRAWIDLSGTASLELR
ncbi:MAG TPA: DUF6510 family protein [Gaiellaceae bacterium]